VGALSLGGTYQQNSAERHRRDLPSDQPDAVAGEHRPVDHLVAGMTFRNHPDEQQPFAVEVIGEPGARDTIQFDTRTTTFSFQTPLRIGRWNWTNGFLVTDQTSDQQRLFVIPDTGSGPADTLVYARTFSTGVDWQTGINLPQLFSGSWKLQPGVAIVNTTSAGPFMLRNPFSTASSSSRASGRSSAWACGRRCSGRPGVGPLARIRHSFSPIVDYRYALGAQVPRTTSASDPTGTA
jgi:hypothetical protein